MSEQIPKSTLFKSTIFLTWNGSKLIVSAHLQRCGSRSSCAQLWLMMLLVIVAMVRAGSDQCSE